MDHLRLRIEAIVEVPSGTQGRVGEKGGPKVAAHLGSKNSLQHATCTQYMISSTENDYQVVTSRLLSPYSHLYAKIAFRASCASIPNRACCGVGGGTWPIFIGLFPS